MRSLITWTGSRHLPLALVVAVGAGCSADDTSDSSNTTDSATETSTGDGDGDTSGDGDGDGDTATGDGDGDTAGDPFTLTSPAFVDGGMIPLAHSCEGENVSPQLDWVGAPPGTASFAVFFTDLTFNFDHSAIWNIPADLTGLPEAIERAPMPAEVPGASQADSYAGWPGYAGPCPPQTHTYQFILYALDVATLDGEIDPSASLEAAQMAFEAHVLDTATLDGEFTPN